ncbi:MAG: hypothetical protein P4M14_05370 [Gammaproteobacteria bacterium]|nr:hypothetical protein [Gammaproteobacteria bacterium]
MKKIAIAVICLQSAMPVLASASSDTSSPSEPSVYSTHAYKATTKEYKGTLDPIFRADGHFYLGAAVETSQLRLDNTHWQVTYYGGFLNDAYPGSNTDTNAAVVDLHGGYEFTGMGMRPAIALGLGVYTMPSEYSESGRLVETALGDAPSTLYNYKYNISSSRLMAEAKFTWTFNHFTPFIDVGIGSAWTRPKNYAETSIDSIGYPPLPPFRNHTNVNFAYQAGVGVGYAFNFNQSASEFQHERISLGYRYVSLGNVSFSGRGSVYPYKLNLGRISSNDVYLSYTHLF